MSIPKYLPETATPEEILDFLKSRVPGLIWKMEAFKADKFLIEGSVSRSLTGTWYDYRVVQLSVERLPDGFVDHEGVLSGILPRCHLIFGTCSLDSFESLTEAIARLFQLLEAHAVVKP